MDGTAEPGAPVAMITSRKASSDTVVPALTRGFAILELVAKHPGLDFTAIHGRLALPKSSTHNLLGTLSRLGVLRMRPDRGFVLGLKLTELGAFAASHHFVEAESIPLLRALASELQLTCHLGVIEGAEAVYLSKIECDQPIKVDSWVGKRFSLHSSALGKVLLAWLPEAELQQALAAINWVQATPHTIPSQAAMHAHLQLVRTRGWATDDEENVPNIRCVAAPVFDRHQNVAAAISAVGTILQLDQPRFELIAPRLVAVANEISRRAFTG
jgi:DNA-binding IclR family transcriptional regulator